MYLKDGSDDRGQTNEVGQGEARYRKNCIGCRMEHNMVKRGCAVCSCLRTREKTAHPYTFLENTAWSKLMASRKVAYWRRREPCVTVFSRPQCKHLEALYLTSPSFLFEITWNWHKGYCGSYWSNIISPALNLSPSHMRLVFKGDRASVQTE